MNPLDTDKAIAEILKKLCDDDAIAYSSLDYVRGQQVHDEAKQALSNLLIRGKIEELKNIPELSDGQTVNPLAPEHDNYILKITAVNERKSELEQQLTKETK